MAKRKKHRKKQNNHKQNVVKTTTNSSVVKPAEDTKNTNQILRKKLKLKLPKQLLWVMYVIA